MNRREFLKWSASSLAAALVWGVFGKKAAWPQPTAELAVVTGGTARERVEAAVRAMGGINRFVRPGNRVVVKPNIAWARTPEQGANTDPEVVAAVVNLCRQAGARQVVVIDHTCSNYRMSYQQSGIEAAARQAGAQVLPADQEKYYRQVNVPEARILRSPLILNEVLDCDVLINLPVVKVHGGADVTLAMKNLMGVVWDRGAMHSTNLHQTIADLNFAVKPKLVLLDATRILTSNGPAGPGNVRTLNQIVAATDTVAADAYGAKILGFSPEKIPHIRLAHQMGLGEMDLQSVRINNIKLS